MVLSSVSWVILFCRFFLHVQLYYMMIMQIYQIKVDYKIEQWKMQNKRHAIGFNRKNLCHLTLHYGIDFSCKQLAF